MGIEAMTFEQARQTPTESHAPLSLHFSLKVLVPPTEPTLSQGSTGGYYKNVRIKDQ